MKSWQMLILYVTTSEQPPSANEDHVMHLKGLEKAMKWSWSWDWICQTVSKVKNDLSVLTSQDVSMSVRFPVIFFPSVPMRR